MISEVIIEAGAICSSYTTEARALSKNLDWVTKNQKRDSLIITDSMSLFSAPRSNDWRDTDPILVEIKEKLRNIMRQPTLLWVPLHCIISGNDRVDKLADMGTIPVKRRS